MRKSSLALLSRMHALHAFIEATNCGTLDVCRGDRNTILGGSGFFIPLPPNNTHLHASAQVHTGGKMQRARSAPVILYTCAMHSDMAL